MAQYGILLLVCSDFEFCQKRIHLTWVAILAQVKHAGLGGAAHASAPRPAHRLRRAPWRPAAGGRRQTLQGSFSAVSKPDFARKYAFESSRRDLHNALLKFFV